MVVKRAALAGKGDVALEELLRWDPQFIGVGRQYSAQLILGDPRWAGTTAVKTDLVRELPDGVFYWDGSTEGILLMLYLAKALHPDRFPDLDLTDEVRAYYRRFYGYSLDAHEAALLLAAKDRMAGGGTIPGKGGCSDSAWVNTW